MSEQAVFDALKYRIEVDACGSRWYYNSAGQLHRDDGPAIEFTGGHKEWWQNDQRHRVDGAAVIWADGTELWYQNGLRHRTDGAAVIWANRTKEWYINGVRLSKAEFNQAIKSL